MSPSAVVLRGRWRAGDRLGVDIQSVAGVLPDHFVRQLVRQVQAFYLQ